MLYYKSFKFCPVCGVEYKDEDYIEKDIVFICKNCDYRFYQNMDATVAVVIPKLDEPEYLLLTTRNMDPGKGKLDIPGGFLKYGETPIEGAKREVFEEMDLEVKITQYVSSQVTNYQYQGREYNHITQYFLAKPIDSSPQIRDKEENQDVQFFLLDNVLKSPQRMSFQSDIMALKEYKRKILMQKC